MSESINESQIDYSMIEQIIEMADGDRGLLNEIIEVFLDDAPGRLQAIESALKTNDSEAAHRAAHTLKGSCSNLGLIELQKACAMLDNRVRKGDMTNTGELYDNIIKAWHTGAEILKAEQNKRS